MDQRRMHYEKLIDDLKNGIGLIKVNSAIELGRLKEKKAIPVLVEALTYSNMAVRSNAAFALGELGAREAVTGLIALLKDPEERVRKSAAKALGMIGAPDSAAPLVSLLESEKSRIVLKSALRSLGQVGDSKTLPAVARYVSNADPTLSETAKQAVESLSKK